MILPPPLWWRWQSQEGAEATGHSGRAPDWHWDKVFAEPLRGLFFSHCQWPKKKVKIKITCRWQATPMRSTRNEIIWLVQHLRTCVLDAVLSAGDVDLSKIKFPLSSRAESSRKVKHVNRYTWCRRSLFHSGSQDGRLYQTHIGSFSNYTQPPPGERGYAGSNSHFFKTATTPT